MAPTLLLFCWLSFLVCQGNASPNPLIYLDIVQDQIAMSSETLDEISTIPPSLDEMIVEEELLKSSAETISINCFPYASSLSSPNNAEGDREDECKKKGCSWYPRGTGKNWESYCFTPKDYGYVMEGSPEKTANGYKVLLKKYGTKTYFGSDSKLILLTVETQSDYRIRFSFADANDTARWQVPLKIHAAKGIVKTPLYDLGFMNDPLFIMRIFRKSSGAVIFDTSLGGLTFSDQFLQISTKLPSRNIYGFGEQKQPAFRHEFKGESTWPMYSRGAYNKSSGISTTNLNGVHPYYTVLENDGNTHSVLIVNSNAQEVQLLPVPGLIYRTIGGILDFYVFMGPTPDETVQQLTEAIGRPFLPPYYALGLQIGKDSYSTLENIKDLMKSVQENEIPFDILYESGGEFVEQYKNNSSDVLNLVKELEKQAIHFSITLNPFVFNSEKVENSTGMSATDNSIWIKSPQGNPVEGLINSKLVHYPDFSLNTTLKWWRENLQHLQSKLGVNAMELVYNEPYNEQECAESNGRNQLPYLPAKIGDCLNTNTISADSQQDAGSHYDLHSLYGWTQSRITAEAMQNFSLRPLVLSQSTFLGSGQWSGHSFNNNVGKWSDLHLGIIQMLQFNQFGIPYVGSNLNALDDSIDSDEFHLRWMQIQAFNPLARVPNSLDLQNANDNVVEGIKKVIKIRYNLLPYMYTLMYLANTKGNTVVRSLWHEFRRDPLTSDIDRQFLLGTGLLISPVLENGVRSLEAYIPRDRWYDYYTGVELTERGRHVMLDAPEDKIPLLIRGYHIIPTQEPGLNTKSSRRNNLTLIVALCAKGNGKGELYVDDGQSLDSIEKGQYFLAKYSVTNKTVNGLVEHDGFPEISTKFLSAIRLLGAADVKTVSLNGNLLESVRTVPDSAETLITGLNLPINSNFTLTWTTGGAWY